MRIYKIIDAIILKIKHIPQVIKMLAILQRGAWIYTILYLTKTIAVYQIWQLEVIKVAILGAELM